MTIFPPYLKKGDTIGIVCPAGFMPFDKAAICIETLRSWGYQVKVGKTLGNQFNYFSGTDEERLDDLQQMLDDNNVQAVLCGRGGYGTSRIIDALSFKKFKRRPKWIIGFSDITILHSHIFSKYKIASLHAPMAAAFNNEGATNEFVLSLKRALEGYQNKYHHTAHPYNKIGKASGVLVGGNLSLIVHAIGTKSDIKTKGKILFLEDVGEYFYNVDRMLLQLKRSGKFEELAGLVIGGFTDMKDTVIPFGKEIYDVIKDVVAGYDFPVCFNFPVSHEKENYALKVGAKYKLQIDEKEVVLEEA